LKETETKTEGREGSGWVRERRRKEQKDEREDGCEKNSKGQKVLYPPVGRRQIIYQMIDSIL
jgi:hypothetical protein